MNIRRIVSAVSKTFTCVNHRLYGYLALTLFFPMFFPMYRLLLSALAMSLLQTA